jgi:hypothetical protein
MTALQSLDLSNTQLTGVHQQYVMRNVAHNKPHPGCKPHTSGRLCTIMCICIKSQLLIVMGCRVQQQYNGMQCPHSAAALLH